jgi:hypothetical protein
MSQEGIDSLRAARKSSVHPKITGMKVLLRHKENGLFMGCKDVWTSREGALDFHSTGEALRYCRERNFFEAFAVLSFGETRPDINLGLFDIHEFQSAQETLASAPAVERRNFVTGDTQFSFQDF